MRDRRYMAICIDIIKRGEVGDLHIYYVNKIGADRYEFYVAIAAENQTISFYKDQELKHLLKVIDVNDPTHTIGVDGIPSFITGRVVMRCFRALLVNNFPETMGYYS